MPWTELAATTLRDTDLRLYGAEDGSYMIRANGLELMSSRNHGSEDALGAMAGALARQRGRKPRLLIGGLGLGYTLAAAAKVLDGSGEIIVAEISPDVIDWFERYLAPTLFPQRLAHLRFIAADVATVAGAAGTGGYDVIVLDVDNGPRAFATASNDCLYSAEGLATLRAALRKNGVLLVWSGFEAPEFAARAAAAGFAVACEPVAISVRPGLSHYIYRLTKAQAGSS